MKQQIRRNYFVGVALWSYLMVAIGFRSYFVSLLTGNAGDYSPIIHLHVAIYITWIIIFSVQSLRIRKGNVRTHRSWGAYLQYYGILIIAMGVIAAFSQARMYLDEQRAEQATFILNISLRDMGLFTLLYIPAILYKNTPRLHRKFMLSAHTVLLVAAVGRIPWPAAYFPFLFYPVWLLPVWGEAVVDMWIRKKIPWVSLCILIFLILASYIYDRFLDFSFLI